MSKKFDRNALLALPHKNIKARYEALFGEPPRSPNKTWMVNKMQEEHERRRAEKKAEKALAAAAAPRASPRAEEAPTEETIESANLEQPEAATIAQDAEAVPVVEEVAPPPADRAPTRKLRRGARADDETRQDADAEDSPAPEAVEADVAAATGPAAEIIAPRAPAPAPAPRPAREESPAVASTEERGRLTSMTVEELRARYEQVLGRRTSSVDRDYLVWKIRMAEKGRIRVGPVVPGKRLEGALAGEDKTLPLTIPAAAVVAMDAAWRRLGFTSRMKFMRAAIRAELARGGESDAADLFVEKGAA